MHVVDERVGGLVGKSPMIFTDKLSAEMSKRQFKKEQKKQKKKKKKKTIHYNIFITCHTKKSVM